MNAVVTLSIGDAEWLKAGLPSKMEYARRIGADFVNITERKLGGSVASEKYQIGGLLEKYDRIFYLDADSVIDPSAPNVFEVVPPDRFGIFDESHSTRGIRHSLMAWLKEGWPDEQFSFYANNGVFVCLREHQWLFDHGRLNTKLKTYEQTHMVYRIWRAMQKGSIKVCWLAKSWNYMPRCWIGGPDPGWIPEDPPTFTYVHHFPCHRPEERLELMGALNKEYGL